MPLRLEIKKKLQARSERVKCVEFHPQEPWVLAALYSGHVFLWNYETETLEKTFEICDAPVRCAKFIVRKQWFVTGSDDMVLRVYNYNTMEKIREWEAHPDYIRSISIHPSLPYILSASDDMCIKIWDWDKGFDNIMICEGHTHYVMQVEINPKDPNTFATASLDRTIKIWGLTSPTHHFSLEGHEKGVNCISYFAGGDRPFLVSGGDDLLVKIWDYQAKSCVATLDGHSANVSATCFHPTLPLIMTGSEDGTLRMWHSTTYRLENTLNYGMERIWYIGSQQGSNKLCVGYDEGTVVLQLGQEEPVVSMDSVGNIVWVDNHAIIFSNVRSMGAVSSKDLQDGEALSLASKDLGNCEIYPQTLHHSPNGRVLCICGDGEYTIYTARKLKNTGFGSAIEFVWSDDSKVFATRENNSVIKVFQNSKEIQAFRPSFPIEGIFGGHLLGVRSSEFIDFYDWQTCSIVRRILVCPRKVLWSESGTKVAVACEESFYILQYDSEVVQKFLDEGIETDEQGIDRAFERHQEIHESVTTGDWAGDFCFIYTTESKRLNYYVGDQPDQGEVTTLAHLDRPLYLLRYLPRENRVFLMDKHHTVRSYGLLVDVLAYQVEIVSGDYEKAAEILGRIPTENHNRLARFLESQDLKEMALDVTSDPEHKFDLAVQLGKLEMAREILKGSSDADAKWRQLGDMALKKFNLELVEECGINSKDLGLLLLLYTSCGNRDGMTRLVEMAKEKGVYNVAFVCLFLLNRISDCISLLCEIDRIPEAAFVARTYAPSEIDRVVEAWRGDLNSLSPVIAKSITRPADQPGRFPEYQSALEAEQWLKQNYYNTSHPATAYVQQKGSNKRNVMEEIQNGTIAMLNSITGPPKNSPDKISPIQPENISPSPSSNGPERRESGEKEEKPNGIQESTEDGGATDQVEKPEYKESNSFDNTPELSPQASDPKKSEDLNFEAPVTEQRDRALPSDDFDDMGDFDETLEDVNEDVPSLDDLSKSLDDLDIELDI
eukprot:149794_1